MGRTRAWAVAGVVGALVLSPAVTAATGSGNAYALVLLPWTLVLWALTRTPRAGLGLRLGTPAPYLAAVAYPVAVMGVAGLVAFVAGRAGAPELAVGAVGLRILVLFLIGTVGAVLTEEGFFRGWLWGVGEEGGVRPRTLLLGTTGVFALWHVAAGVLVLDLSGSLVPVYVVNILLIGGVFGLLRRASGSVLVPSVSHALWNAVSYTVFGMGERPGALRLASRPLLDPEIGALGLVLNLVAVVALWKVLPAVEVGRPRPGGGAAA